MPASILVAGAVFIMMELLAGNYDSPAIKRAKVLVSFGQWGRKEKEAMQKKEEEEEAALLARA